jgi:replicative DNA helicase
MEASLKVLSKIPPSNIEAEQYTLGCMLLDKDAIISAAEKLRKESFSVDAHKEMFDCIIEMNQNGLPVDIITFAEKLKKKEIFDRVGGATYISSLTESVISTANVEAYIKIVEEKYLLRQLVRFGENVSQKGYEDKISIEELLEDAEKGIFDITQSRSTSGFTPISDILYKNLEKIEKLAEKTDEVTGLTTGFKDLDIVTGGLQQSDLVLVAARPAMGKSAFAINMAQNSALRAGASVAIFSLEMSKEQIVMRMISSESMVPLGRILKGELETDDWGKIIKSMEFLSQCKIHIDDTPGITSSEIRSKCRKLKLEKGLDLVVIDYLQLMMGDRRAESRQQEISSISRNLKILAKEMDCPVIALSQLSRAPELRQDHRPILSDLRESGAIEQDADIVMFLYRDDYYNEESEKKNIGELIIAKHRNGPTKTVELAWLGEYTKYGNLQWE